MPGGSQRDRCQPIISGLVPARIAVALLSGNVDKRGWINVRLRKRAAIASPIARIFFEIIFDRVFVSEITDAIIAYVTLAGQAEPSPIRSLYDCEAKSCLRRSLNSARISRRHYTNALLIFPSRLSKRGSKRGKGKKATRWRAREGRSVAGIRSRFARDISRERDFRGALAFDEKRSRRLGNDRRRSDRILDSRAASLSRLAPAHARSTPSRSIYAF